MGEKGLRGLVRLTELKGLAGLFVLKEPDAPLAAGAKQLMNCQTPTVRKSDSSYWTSGRHGFTLPGLLMTGEIRLQSQAVWSSVSLHNVFSKKYLKKLWNEIKQQFQIKLYC